ncbi:MAG TPA: tetratricopeptide repeat protein [Spirochaetota bacterium]|nr:tetratricopeptide repeat protein [Spirochaetota bacterium]HPJ36473.1 tetratricopeptide repeat protein [Spirochaetota bacterium]
MNFRPVFSVILLASLFLNAPAGGRELSAPELNRAGMDALEKGNNETASEYFIGAIVLDPSNKYYCNNMAASLMRRGKYPEAEKFLFHAIKIDGNYTRALSNMAVTLFHLGRYRESYSYYLRSMSADRTYTESRFERGRVKSEIKKISKGKPEDRDLEKIIDYLGDGDKRR